MYPVDKLICSESNVTINIARDRKKRLRVKAMPPRNNANINNCPVSPLLAIGHGGNIDIQYIHTPYGAAEYCSSYSSKAEIPDMQILENMFVKKLSKILLRRDEITYTDQLRSILNSLYCSTKIGSVHACYTLLKLKYVESSRVVEPINPLSRSTIRRQILFSLKDLDCLDPDVSAERTPSPSSSFGKRDAYGAFVKQQNSLGGSGCGVTMFSLYTSYSIRNKDEKSKTKISTPSLLTMDHHGFIIEPKTFSIESIVYVARRKRIVLHLSPHVPVNADDETSCYAVILLHSVWPDGNEDDILGSPPQSAVQRLSDLRKSKKLPTYVDAFLEKVLMSETIMHVQGEPDIERQEEDESNELSEDIRPDLHVEDQDFLTSEGHNYEETDVVQEIESVQDHRVRENVPKAKMHRLANFISEQQRKFIDNYLLENQLTADQSESGPDYHFTNPKWKSFNEKLLPGKLANKQREAFDIVISYVNGSRSGQLMMFMSGEGGTGKSEVIKLIMEYTRIFYGKTFGLYGPVIALGPTGVASNNIGGFTWESACKLSKSSNRRTNASLDSKITMGRNIEGVKLIIIDEVSMISCESLHLISTRFRDARTTQIPDGEERKRLASLPFGGIHVLYVGDFYQLPPVQSTPLYQQMPKSKLTDAQHGRRLWCMLRHYVELDVNYRLKDGDEGTKDLANCLKELRKGCVSNRHLAIPKLSV